MELDAERQLELLQIDDAGIFEEGFYSLAVAFLYHSLVCFACCTCSENNSILLDEMVVGKGEKHFDAAIVKLIDAVTKDMLKPENAFNDIQASFPNVKRTQGFKNKLTKICNDVISDYKELVDDKISNELKPQLKVFSFLHYFCLMLHKKTIFSWSDLRNITARKFISVKRGAKTAIGSTTHTASGAIFGSTQ